MHDSLPFFATGASAHARDINLLFLFLTGIGVLFVVGAIVLVLAAPLRHALVEHRRPYLASWFPLTWIAIPSAFVGVVFLWGVNLEAAHAIAPADSIDVGVTGRQWSWTFYHEEGPTEFGELHVPLGVPVRLWFSSDDVLHRFCVPALRVHQDVIPGRVTQVWVRATQSGSFRFQCTEYCGPEHAGMSGMIHVLDPIQYEHWITGDAGDLTPEEAGEGLFAAFRCASCHKPTKDGTGPALEGRFDEEVPLADGSTALYDEAYLRESLLEPGAKLVKGYQPVMPSYQAQLDEAQITQLVAYLKTLGAGEKR